MVGRLPHPLTMLTVHLQVHAAPDYLEPTLRDETVQAPVRGNKDPRASGFERPQTL